MQFIKCLRLLGFGRASLQCVADTRHLGVALVTAWAKVCVVQKWADSSNIGTNLTIVKKRGCVANFFHSGPCACHNSLELRDLWRCTTVKNAFAVFHSGPVSFTMPWQVLP